MKDFFISYNKDDRQWAEWIAWTLEEADYEVVIQAWDFRPGVNFVQAMDDATRETEKTVPVLSPSYLEALYTHPEWQAAFARDPQGKKRLVVPFRVRECTPEGLLAQIVYVDLVGMPPDQAKLSILGAFSERAKPAEPPAFPGAAPAPRAAARVAPHQVEFPGDAVATEVAESIVQGTSRGVLAAAGKPEKTLSPAELLQLLTKVSGLPTQQFNMLLFAANPPRGLVPPMPAPQPDRAQALFAWAVEPEGIGLGQIEELLDRFEQPATARAPVVAPANTRRLRPAMGGDSISHDRGGAATLGCLVRDRVDASRIYLLSDFNAICDLSDASQEGDAVLQPGRLDGGNRASDLIATLARWSRVRDDPAAADQNVSAAIAEIARPDEVSAEIRGLGALAGTGAAKVGMPVRLVGRTSGEVNGQVVQVGARETVPVSYHQIEGGLRGTGSGTGFFPVPFGDLIVCTGMLQPGDSGALLLDSDNRALGLAFAGSEEVSLFHPIQRVLDALGVDLVTGQT